MAFNAGSVTANLELGVGSFVASLDKATRALDAFGREGKQAETGIFSFSGALGTLRDLAIVVPAAINLVKGAVTSLIGVFQDAFEAAGSLELKTIQLGATLAAMGERGVGQATKELVEYAEELSKVTAFSNTAILAVEQQVAVFGLQGEELKEATKSVLDYAAVTGTDAVDAARLLGQTLDGTVGRIGQTIPSLQNLSEAQLKNGKAFEVVADLYGGAAEKIAQTSLGLRERVTNALGNISEALGKAIGPAADVLLNSLRTAFDSVTTTITANAGAIQTNITNLAIALASAIEPTIRLGTTLAVFAAQAASLTINIGGAFVIAIKEAIFGFLSLDAAILHAQASLQRWGESIGITAAGTADYTEKLAQARDILADEAFASIIDTANDTADLAGAAEAAAAGFQAAGDAVAGVVQKIDLAGKLQAGLTEKVDQTAKAAAIVDSLEGSIGQRIARRKAHLDEILGTTQGTAAAATEVASATEAAANATDSLAAAASSAEASFSSMADSAGEISSGGGGGAFGTGGSGDSFGRRSGGAAGLDLSTLESAEAALAAAQGSLGRTFGGLFSRQARRGQRAVVDQIAARVNALREEAQQDGMQAILDALNQSGLLDPVARQQFVEQRLSEAQRLGVIPTGGTRTGAGGFTSIR